MPVRPGTGETWGTMSQATAAYETALGLVSKE